MNNKILKLSAAALMGVALTVPTSCSDLLDQQPIDWYGADNFWQTSDDYIGNWVALAPMFRNTYAMNILFWAGELRGGQFTTDLINDSGAINADVVYNNYDVAHPQFGNFMSTPGFIANLNEMIYRAENQDGLISDQIKNAMLGMAYGMRAYMYFQVYKMWGGAVIRTEPDVLFGERDQQTLYRARSTAQETLDQIKSDVAASLAAFEAAGNKYNFPMNDLRNEAKDYYWSKAATEMLAGEVYLWSAKVSTGNHSAGGAADVAQAKQYFSNVINNYGFSLYNDYFGIWTTPHNSEAIFGFCFTNESEGYRLESVASPQINTLWSKAGHTVAWSVQGPTGFDKTAWDETTGTFANASRFQYYSTDPSSQGAIYTVWNDFNPSPNRYMWKNAMYYQYDQTDGRTAMWYPMWAINDDEEEVYSISNFDPTKHDMIGSFTMKFMPSKTELFPNNYLFWNDQYIYRLTLAYTYMAEIANYEGNYGEIAQWINPIRQRAYGDNWDESKYGFKPSSFTENEAQILIEKNKEFVMEGQRWWDLRRMTTVRDGSETDHMVFQPEGCIGHGLDPAANPWLVAEGDGSLIETQVPVLSTTEAYKLLWPINQDLLNSDPLIEQNPGY